MKKISLLYMLLAWFMFTGCEDDEAEYIAGVVYDVTEQELIVNSSGGKDVNIIINSNTPWTLTGATDWCTFSPESGDIGSTKVNFTLTENTAYDDRNTLMTLVVGDQKTLINVIQKQKDAVVASADKVVFEQGGGEMKVVVESNIDYVVTIPETSAGWISRKAGSPTKALETSSEMFVIAANENTEGRVGYVIIEDEAKRIPDTVKVFQRQKDQLVLLATSQKVPLQGLEFTVDLMTNIEYDVTVENNAQSWLHVLGNDREDVLLIRADEWDVDDGRREGKITVKDKNSELQQIFTVIQEPTPTVRVTPKTASVLQAGGKVTFNVETNVGYEVVLPSRLDWVRVNEHPAVKGMENHTVIFEIDPNPETELPRYAKIVVKDAEGNSIGDTITIEQDGRKRITEREAVYALYYELDGDNWDALTKASWVVGDENLEENKKKELGKYMGISTNKEGKVISVSLSTNLKGEIPASIADLEYLETLQLVSRNNALTGTIPPEIGRLRNLKKLILKGGKFTRVPEELWQLENLEVLQLETASDHALDFLGELHNLTSMSLVCNNTGSLPVEICGLKKLTTLTLGSSAIPSSFTSLPEEIGQMIALTNITITGGLEGELTAGIGNLQDLKSLTITGTQLTALPAEIGNLQNLETLLLNKNTLESVPPEIGKLGALKKLDMSENALAGSLPDELGNLANVTSINLSNNKLTGEIPATFGNLQSATTLDLSNNKLSGSIPYELGATLIALTELNLSNNQLTGGLSTPLFKMPKIATLNLANNRLEGGIPGEMINAKSTLKKLHLQGNKLGGNLPQALGSMELKELNLENNNFTGEIPENIYGGDSKNFTSLSNSIFILNGNRLKGNIPEAILTRLKAGQKNWLIVDQQETYGFDNWEY